MPLLNDMARCQGFKLGKQYLNKCPRRDTCARYVERHTGSDRTPYFEYLCSQNDDSYIQAEKANDT